MAEVDSSLIRRGLWVDHSKGSIVLGSTLTTSTHVGNILVAITALVIALAMGHLWNIVLFLVHQWRARKPSGDGLSRQQQALLRISPAPASFVVDFIKLYKAWRRQTSNAFIRCLVPALVGFLFLISTLAASAFSSEVVKTNDLTILVDSPSCAMVDGYKVYELAASSSTVSSYNEDTRAAALAYAKACYRGSSVPSQCNVYVRPRIESTQSMVPCPFDEALCIGSGNSAVRFDSGFVDSQDDLGFNTGSSDRVQIRKATTCAPIMLDGHTTIVQGEDQQPFMGWRKVLPEEQFIALRYGTFLATGNPNPNTSATYSLASTNITFQYATDLVSYFASPDLQPYNSWSPMAGLRRSDADTTLIFVQLNAVSMAQPSDDPVFSSHNAFTMTQYNNATMYKADSPVGIVGCSEQYQICVGDGKICSPLQPSKRQMFEDLPTGMTEVQTQLARLFTEAVNLYNIGNSYYQTQSVLQIGEKVTGGWLPSLPADQWIQEMKWGADVVWAGIQQVLLDHATGGQDVASEALLQPNTEAARTLCSSQLVHKTGGFANLNVFAFAITMAIAGLIIMTDVFVLKGVIFSRFFRARCDPSISRWVQDGVLQLQRRAYEAEKYDIWQRTNEEIPITDATDLPAWSAGSTDRMSGAISFENALPGAKIPHAEAESVSSVSREASMSETMVDREFIFQPDIPSRGQILSWNTGNKTHRIPEFIA